MKKKSAILLSLSVLALSACVNESLEVTQDTSKEVVITATTGGNGTRTQLLASGSTKTCWQPEDCISVFSFFEGSTDLNVKFQNIEKSNTSTARFSGTIKFVFGAVNPDETFRYGDKWAVYPYDKSNSWNAAGKYMEVSIPATQTAYPGTFDPKAQPLAARSNSTDFAFYNVAGNISFNLPDSLTGIRRIELKGRDRDNDHLTGKVHVSYVGDTIHPSVCGDAANSDTMIVLLPQTGIDTIAAGETYYLSLIPDTLAKGLEMVFYTDTTYATMTIDKQVVTSRNQVLTIDASHFDGLQFVYLPVSKIEMPETLLLDPYDTDSIKVTVHSKDNLADKTLTWSSSDPTSVSVDQNGHVTGCKPGSTAIITARSVACPAITAMCTVTVKDITNLSENGTANCYIVSKKGYYKINAAVKGKTNVSISTKQTESACLLWKTYGNQSLIGEKDLITDVYYKNGFIFFSIPSNLKNGNATVAALSGTGEILWSWHLWICMGYDPAATQQEYPNGAGTFMDRNLGATSANRDSVQILGLSYQWGRKDPFMGNASFREGDQVQPATYYSNNQYKKTIVESNSTTGCVSYAVANPTAFIVSSTNDWVYDNSLTNRWAGDIKFSDPCPRGWTIPQANFMKTALGLSGTYYSATEATIYRSASSTAIRGLNFKSVFGKSYDILYPYRGYMLGNKDANMPGAYYLNLDSFYYWTKITSPTAVGYNGVLQVVSRTSTSTNFSFPMKHGCAVRCVKTTE